MPYYNYRSKQTKNLQCHSDTKTGRRCRNEADIGFNCYYHYHSVRSVALDPCEICENPNLPPKILKCGHKFHARRVMHWHNDFDCPRCEDEIKLSRGDYIDFINSGLLAEKRSEYLKMFYKDREIGNHFVDNSPEAIKESLDSLYDRESL